MPDEHPDPRPGKTAEADLRVALERARGGDSEALPALRQALDSHPEIWRHYGDLAAHAERSWVELIAGPDLALSESLARRAASLKAELSGPDPSPLERLLVGRVVACWLQLHHADASLAQAGPVGIRQADLGLKRLARSHRSYLMSIGALATVRRLLPAAVLPSEAPGSIAAQTGGVAPTAAAEKPGLAVPEVVVAEVGDADRLVLPAGPAPLALFDRDRASTKPVVGPGGQRRGRGRSAS